jgi:hypothetical protein
VEDCPESILVIAWGNPLREDDGVAWHVLEALRALRPHPALPALHLRHAHQLVPEMAECVSRATGVVFVDARREKPQRSQLGATLPVSFWITAKAKATATRALRTRTRRLNRRPPPRSQRTRYRTKSWAARTRRIIVAG